MLCLPVEGVLGTGAVVQIRHSHTGLLVGVTRERALADTTALSLELSTHVRSSDDTSTTSAHELCEFKVIPGYKASKTGDSGPHLTAHC